MIYEKAKKVRYKMKKRKSNYDVLERKPSNNQKKNGPLSSEMNGYGQN